MLRLSLVLLTATAAIAGTGGNYTYLALGDSVAFGLDITKLPPISPTLPLPSAFVGYPEVISTDLSKPEVNASCPGETSGSFIDVTAPDYGCNGPGPQAQPPFKTIGLKASYAGAQLDYALTQLKANKDINLVTLSIGANDILLLLRGCSEGADVVCVQNGLPAVLTNYGKNLSIILNAIRTTGKYHGDLVVLKYYSPSIPLNPIAIQLNAVTESVGKAFGVKFADAFTAFQVVSIPYGGDPCKAGLLIRLSATTCDIHPTPFGTQILAKLNEFAIGKLGFVIGQ